MNAIHSYIYVLFMNVSVRLYEFVSALFLFEALDLTALIFLHKLKHIVTAKQV